MTEQPDTAAIREWYVGRRRPSSPTMIAALCDALDTARTESEALRREQIYAVRLAEAAEAECVRHATRSEELENALDAARAELMDQSDRRMDAKFYADPELLVRAEAAEARINAALAACSDWETGDHWSPESLLRAVRRALTEGTSNGD